MAENKNHEICISNRGRVLINGVIEVISADKVQVVLDTSFGRLIIRGSSFSMGKLDVTNGELSFTGEVSSLEYKNQTKSGLKRLFR